MTVKEIIAIELANVNSIYLLKEGMFYRAYNRSAMRVVIYLKPFKVNHKFVKTVQQEIFYVGFPCSSLKSIQQHAIEKGWQILELSENGEDAGKKIVISGVSDKDEDYQPWVDKQYDPLNPPNGGLQDAVFDKQTNCVLKSLSSGEGFRERSVVMEDEPIIQLITDFPIENATPKEALMFVNKLKQLVRHGNVR
ncbi:MAG: hypothetical protein Q7U47_03700 [Paludibacter sp.]|nr:hypothetical protein [Paludibacter sp.]